MLTLCFNDLDKSLFMFYGIHLYINQIDIKNMNVVQSKS